MILPVEWPLLIRLGLIVLYIVVIGVTAFAFGRWLERRRR